MLLNYILCVGTRWVFGVTAAAAAAVPVGDAAVFAVHTAELA